jgi:hypothetical protein
MDIHRPDPDETQRSSVRQSEGTPVFRTRFAWILTVYTVRGGELHRVPFTVYDG